MKPHLSTQESQHRPPIRFVTATSLFDGHDAAINIIRRLLQRHGVEVIHLGHNRSVEEIVDAAIQEDAQGIAISSYQGGHNEFFCYMVDLLKEKEAEHIKVFAGGGGVIIPKEIKMLMDYGVTRIYSPEDGSNMGLEGMIQDMIQQADFDSLPTHFQADLPLVHRSSPLSLSRFLTWIERNIHNDDAMREKTADHSRNEAVPVIGITGTGGAGKSCITDELLRRFLMDFDELQIGVISVDPSKRKTGGSLLGDRIRMNAINTDRVFMRSVATRRANLSTSQAVPEMIKAMSVSGIDLVLVETAGISQSDSEITDWVDLSIYVMTPEFGATMQLEKIDMLDYADLIVINKYDKRGSEDALNAVRKQYRRNHNDFQTSAEDLPVFGTVASHFNDAGVNHFYRRILQCLEQKEPITWHQVPDYENNHVHGNDFSPPAHADYLGKVVTAVRDYKNRVEEIAQTADACYQTYGTLKQLGCELPQPLTPVSVEGISELAQPIAVLYNRVLKNIPEEDREQFQHFQDNREKLRQPQFEYQVRQKTIVIDNQVETLSGTQFPKVITPPFQEWGSIFRWMGLENFPGQFPFTAGLFPFKRQNEDPTRMFAGEGGPERTNQRFHYLSAGQPAKRLSTAFDSVTLYGEDPHKRPDIYGKVGNSGVSICTVDDAKRVFSGFDLCAPSTSVSMTINGPAPIMLACFMNAAIDQQVEQHLANTGKLAEKQKEIAQAYQAQGVPVPEYRGTLPEGHNGLGLGLLGISGDQLVEPEVYQKIKQEVLSQVRGTIQADILKEDQAQNTCIFSTEFALKMMADIQVYFTESEVKNFYSVSISGYHIAEAGANPITQVALTLSNGFTFIENYLARGLPIDAFAQNLSFFFSNGMDPEYAVIGRVARRIFAIALRDVYKANERSQKLKYHIQTSGRSLHAQEIDFNDIRTTLQALYAIYDNCNSLHTNAYDEAITTPTEESVRRAMAIQLIINREFGLNKNENSLQGSFIVETLTDLVEEAILTEFLRISDRGGVLGAMETMYQRSKIQEESLHYETLKHSGDLPIIGVNTFLNPNSTESGDHIELIRSTTEEKEAQLKSLAEFHEFHAPQKEKALGALRYACLNDKNIFEALMEATKVCSMGQISRELYRFGGEYRRNM